ncbi:MAG: hypothetical protein ACR2QB_08600 [Gammaproteobacteria bacterium]
MNAVSSFAFTISLAAVINGLGIVRLLSALAEYLRRRDRIEVGHFWVYGLLLLFQFVLHVLFWWAMFGVRSVGGFNFVGYMYLLVGPVCIYLATSLLIPDVDGDSKSVDLRAQYFHLAPAHFSVIATMWFWAVFLWPVLTGKFAPTAPMLFCIGSLALVLRFSKSERLHSILVPIYCFAIVSFIGLFQLRLGSVATAFIEGAAR